jgi:redox-sensitive bicupin YhaK (pirin superfamily)
VNLPKAQKMSKPRYQGITKDQIPVIQLAGGGHARVIAGELLGRIGPAKTFTPVNLFDVILKAGSPPAWHAAHIELAEALRSE